MDDMPQAPYAVITGASSGIGFELARQFAEHGFDLLVTAESEQIEEAASKLRSRGAPGGPVRAHIADKDGGGWG
jgi:short-subunit dehydrogenase